jgi:NitT/TauT family transport system substrate-binding protein
MYAASFTQRSPEAARGFMVAYLRGVRDYLVAVGPRKRDQEQVFKTLAEAGVVRDPAMLPRMRPVGFDVDARVNTKSLDEDQDIYVRNGHMRERIDLSQAVDLSYVDHAVRVLGPYQR